MMKSTTDEIKEFKDKVDEINHVQNLLEFYWDYVRERIGVPIESQHYIESFVDDLSEYFGVEFKYAASWAGHGYNWYKWKLEGCPY